MLRLNESLLVSVCSSNVASEEEIQRISCVLENLERILWQQQQRTGKIKAVAKNKKKIVFLFCSIASADIRLTATPGDSFVCVYVTIADSQLASPTTTSNSNSKNKHLEHCRGYDKIDWQREI